MGKSSKSYSSHQPHPTRSTNPPGGHFAMALGLRQRGSAASVLAWNGQGRHWGRCQRHGLEGWHREPGGCGGCGVRLERKATKNWEKIRGNLGKIIGKIRENHRKN